MEIYKELFQHRVHSITEYETTDWYVYVRGNI